MNLNRTLALAAVISLVGGVAASAPRAAHAQTPGGQIVFDAITGINIGGPQNDLQTPGTTDRNNVAGAGFRTFLGQNFVPVSTPLPTTQITGIEFYYASTAGAIAYTDLVANIQFYSGATNDASNTGTTPVFSSPTALQSVSLGPQIFSGSGARLAQITFATPIALQNIGSNPGVVINLQGNTGAGLTSSNNLFTAVRGGYRADGSLGPAIAVGTIPFGNDPVLGYYRNRSGQSDFNFLGIDAVNNTNNAPIANQQGANSALAIRLYAAVPEPGTFALAAVGLLAFAPVVRRRRL